MNGIVIVGHPTSDYRNIEQLLRSTGMQTPNPSLHENLSAIEINRQICATHGIDTRRSHSCAMLQSSEVSAVWQLLIRNWLSANMDQRLIVWADPAAIHLLDIWRDASDSLFFVLAYESPEAALFQKDETGSKDDQEDMPPETLIEEWNAYNQSLLSFFKHNPSRCILVDSRQVRSSPNSLVKAVSERCAFNLTSSDELPISRSSRIPQPHVAHIEQPAKDFIVREILRRLPDTLALYQALKTAATLPSLADNDTDSDADDAWRALRKVLFQNNHLIKKLHKLRSSQSQLIDYRNENFQLQTQLHKLQNELEQQFVDNLELQRRIADLETTDEPSASTAPTNSKHPVRHVERAPTGAAERFKQELEYQVGKKVLQGFKRIWPLPFLPWRVTFLIGRFTEATRQNPTTLPPLALYIDYGDIEKYKQHLTYKLGVTWLRTYYRPGKWLVMPFALLRTYVSHLISKKHRKSAPNASLIDSERG